MAKEQVVHESLGMFKLTFDQINCFNNFSFFSRSKVFLKINLRNSYFWNILNLYIITNCKKQILYDIMKKLRKKIIVI